MFWKNFIDLCNKKRMKPTQVIKALGISGGSITGWKNGTIPSKKTLSLLANYFEVEIEDFFINRSAPTETTEDEANLL